MKQYLIIALMCALACACRKQEPQIPVAYEKNVQQFLRSNMAKNDFAALDFQNEILSKQPESWFLRIGLLGKNISSDFVLLQTDSVGNCHTGNFVHILRDSSDLKTFNGRIITASLKHQTVNSRKILNSQILSNCPGDPAEESTTENGGCAVVPSCSDCLSEVIVVGYLPAGGGSTGISYSDYINLSQIAGSGTPTLPGTGNGVVSGIYSPVLNPGNSVAAKPAPSTSKDVTITFEENSAKPAIDVAAFMKCFSAIPDEGAVCSVTIFDDLPVNDNPAYIFNILSGATGHCFLQLSKTNGAQSVQQIIGFTTSKPLAMLGIPVAGKMVDNTGHKYNASLTMSLTPAQLATEIKAITNTGSKKQYDIWEYNCVNYAVDILNAVRPNAPLEVIQLNDVTSGDSYSTPQGLYLTLEQMKKQNGADAKNITIDVIRNAGKSNGVCN